LQQIRVRKRKLAHDRKALRAILSPVNSAALALQKVNDTITKASSQPDFDPSALARRQARLRAISAQFQSAAASLDRLSVSAPLAPARSSLGAAIAAYRDAAKQLQTAITDIESGNHTGLTAELGRAGNDLLQAHAQVTVVQDRLSAAS
jgi:DNA repair ATPase RecN